MGEQILGSTHALAREESVAHQVDPQARFPRPSSDPVPSSTDSSSLQRNSVDHLADVSAGTHARHARLGGRGVRPHIMNAAAAQQEAAGTTEAACASTAPATESRATPVAIIGAPL